MLNINVINEGFSTDNGGGMFPIFLNLLEKYKDEYSKGNTPRMIVDANIAIS